ncbi:MAG: DUF3817 domain-containing protein [Flavobacterium sp.]|nr:DUF3817 domain-containing protein [Flavobacterium sp.]
MNKIFKFVAIAEGVSYLALFVNMIFNKHSNPELYKSLLFPIGMTHGILFISYIYLAFMIKENQSWNGKEFAIVLAGSLIPFGTFYIERKYLKNA